MMLLHAAVKCAIGRGRARRGGEQGVGDCGCAFGVGSVGNRSQSGTSTLSGAMASLAVRLPALRANIWGRRSARASKTSSTLREMIVGILL